MAKRPYYFVTDDNRVQTKFVEFTWNAGLSPTQKKKNIKELHEKAAKEDGVKLLEVSSKSDNELGKKLSAFMIKYGESTLENYYQAGKVFENGGPYKDLIYTTPKESKRDERLKKSGAIIGYHDFLTGEDWGESFYYGLYIRALKNALTEDEIKELVSYDGYTDIEFNPSKGINTQAKACAIAKLMYKMFGEIPNVNGNTEFERFYQTFVK